MDWATLIAGIVSVFGNLFGGAWSNGRNVDMQRETNSLMQQLAGQANQWSIEQWNRENAYNTATAQRARFENANLNPALMMSQGGIMNEAAQSPAVQMPSGLSAPRVNNPINIDPLTAAQISNINAQTEKTETETDAISQKLPQEVQKLQNENEQIKANTQKLNDECAKLRQEVVNLKEEQRNMVVNRGLMEQAKVLNQSDFERKCKETDALVKELVSRVSLNEADVDLKKSVQSLNWQSYAYNSQANTWRLLGLEQEFYNAKKQGQLYDDEHKLKQDQHTINRLQSALLGYDVSNGYAQYHATSSFNAGLRGKSSVDRDVYKGVNSLIQGINYMLTPVKGIVSFVGK